MKIKSIWIEAEEWGPGRWAPKNDNTDAIVTCNDGSRWVASFFTYRNITSLVKKNKRTGECLSGKYFWSSDMILVDEVTRARIEEVTQYLAEQEPLQFQSVFTRIDDDADKPGD